MQNLTRLVHHLLDEIILDEIIENHILKSRELRVNIASSLCSPCRTDRGLSITTSLRIISSYIRIISSYMTFQISS